MIKLGVKARDKITGAEGTVTGKAEYLYGCTQYLVIPLAKEGVPREGAWFDEGRLVVIGEGIKPEEVQADKPGGPNIDSPRGRF